MRAVIANPWVVRTMFHNGPFLQGVQLRDADLESSYQDSLSDYEVIPACLREVPGNRQAIGAAKVIDIIGSILPNVYFPVRVGYFVNRRHTQEFHSRLYFSIISRCRLT